jgi:hypothetical protein
MAVDERRRSGLFERLAATLGPDEATTMFDLLPPAGAELALRSDIADLEGRIDRRFEEVDRRFEQVDRRFDAIDARFSVVDDRFDQLERRIVEEVRLSRSELVADFRGELNAAVSGQARLVLTGSIATALSILAAAVAVAQIL